VPVDLVDEFWPQGRGKEVAHPVHEHKAAVAYRLGCVDEPTGKLAAAAYANLQNFVVRQIAEALKGHGAAAGTDIAQSARHLVSVIEGLRWPLLFGAYTEPEALDVLDAQLDQIFGEALP
jgi:hypothetical protein